MAKKASKTAFVLCDDCIREGATLAPDGLEEFVIIRTDDKKGCEFCKFAIEQGRARGLNEEELAEAEEMRKRGEL